MILSFQSNAFHDDSRFRFGFEFLLEDSTLRCSTAFDISSITIFPTCFRFTFECRVESDTVPEVRWYKDNLPLTSPDYETKYDRGLATLTIEEIFSEDTARYTCRVTNQAGTAESSAYLTVKG